MARMFELGEIRPLASRSEAKGDVTSRVAREIVDGETAARAAKTERLREARLAQETGEKPGAAPVKMRRAR